MIKHNARLHLNHSLKCMIRLMGAQLFCASHVNVIMCTMTLDDIMTTLYFRDKSCFFSMAAIKKLLVLDYGDILHRKKVFHHYRYAKVEWPSVIVLPCFFFCFVFSCSSFVDVRLWLETPGCGYLNVCLLTSKVCVKLFCFFCSCSCRNGHRWQVSLVWNFAMFFCFVVMDAIVGVWMFLLFFFFFMSSLRDL